MRAGSLSADIHLEGMGWQGSILALLLAREGRDFTWNDTETTINAWKASTGSVYPDSDPRAVASKQAWHRWLDDGLLPAGTTELCDYVYTSKNPPHGGPKAWARVGAATISSENAIQVNVPAVVKHARLTFADRRVPRPRSDARRYVITHGFSQRLHRYVWGWNVAVKLSIDPALTHLLAGRPTIYCRPTRFVTAYAYPIPGLEEWWFAGANGVVQVKAQKLDAEKHYERWCQQFAQLAPFARVVDRSSAVQGWRPQGRPTDPGWPIIHERAGRTRLLLPSMYHSGVRLAPSVMSAALQQIGIS
jgi:hypothetical protein